MKIWIIGLFFFALNRGFAQHGPGGKYLTPFPDNSAALNEQRAELMAARQAQAQAAYYAQLQAEAQKAEVQMIFARDPWRRIDNTTNYSGSPGWFEFQGQVQEMRPDGVVFKGKWGAVLTVYPTATGQTHLTTTQNSGSQNFQNQSTTYQNPQTYNSSSASGSSYSSITDTTYNRTVFYGDDVFFVANFPYPASLQQGFDHMMAREAGYTTFTNQTGRSVTFRKLDYGIPCAKIWSKEELAAAQQKPKNAALKANQQAAERGDAYGLLRMGERYRDGDGVEKDLAKAKEYLQKATDAGSTTAKDELTHLPAE